jgi:hypothetical protein
VLGFETLRYVPIDENLHAEVKTRKACLKYTVTEEYWFGGGYDIFEDLMVCEAPLRVRA